MLTPSLSGQNSVLPIVSNRGREPVVGSDERRDALYDYPSAIPGGWSAGLSHCEVALHINRICSCSYIAKIVVNTSLPTNGSDIKSEEQQR